MRSDYRNWYEYQLKEGESGGKGRGKARTDNAFVSKIMIFVRVAVQ